MAADRRSRGQDARSVSVRRSSWEKSAVSPNDLIARIKGYSGVQLAEVFTVPDLNQEIKWHSKYAATWPKEAFSSSGSALPGVSSRRFRPWVCDFDARSGGHWGGAGILGQRKQ